MLTGMRDSLVVFRYSRQIYIYIYIYIIRELGSRWLSVWAG